MKINKSDESKYEKKTWVKIINSLSGPKSANLLGTISADGTTNLSMISSVFHLGASPPLMGYISRPHSPDSPRHSLINIKETGCFTINHVHQGILTQAHQTSARYAREVSEFEACDIESEIIDGFQAPFVRESHIKIGLNLVETIDIKINNTVMVVGEIQFFEIPDPTLQDDGYIDIEEAGSLSVTGLDSYHSVSRLTRLSYAKPNKPVVKINLSGK